MSVIFDFIKNFFSIPFGYILSLFYNTTGSYILAIVLLTIIIKLCFLPDAIKQQKNLIKKIKFNSEINILKKQYVNDPQKLNEEINSLKATTNQKKGNIGCLSFIIQLVIMIGLFGVMYTPLTNILNISETTIAEMKTIMSETIPEETDSNMLEIEILKEVDNYKETLISNKVITEETFDNITSFHEKYKFLGLDLSQSPKLTKVNVLWLIPLLVLITGISSQIYSLIKQKKHNPGTGKFTAFDALPFISPMFSFLFAFMFPAGVGLYWAFSSLLSFIQNIILNTIYDPYKVNLLPEVPVTAE